MALKRLKNRLLSSPGNKSDPNVFVETYQGVVPSVDLVVYA